jgi:septum formation protein
VYPTHIPELPRPGENPRDCAERLAREKAQAALHQQPGKLVLGADTVVVIEGEILGKPRDEGDAGRMLRLLSGRTHLVTTGVCLAGLGTENQKLETGFEDTRSETTQVTMVPLSDEDIRSYIATGEPWTKLAPTPFKASLRGGFRVSMAIISTCGLARGAGVQDVAGARTWLGREISGQALI